MPKVSVILPCYNVSKYIDKCMDSLLNQTLSDVEFIFVDDCSTDDTYNQIKKYTDPRIKLIHHEVNKYTAEARNTGIDNATGEYLAFVDPDDYLDYTFLEKLYNLAKQNNADIAKGVMRYIPSKKIVSKNAAIKKNKFHFHFMHQTALYKREMINKYHIRYYIDVICGQFPMIYYANKVITCEDAVYNYVIRPNSCITSGFSIEKWQKLNIKGAICTLDFINKHSISKEDCINILYPFILRLSTYGYNKLSKENKIKAKSILNNYFDDFWNNIKYKDNAKFNKHFFEMRIKYA